MDGGVGLNTEELADERIGPRLRMHQCLLNELTDNNRHPTEPRGYTALLKVNLKISTLRRTLEQVEVLYRKPRGLTEVRRL